jgi:hypothetical protein
MEEIPGMGGMASGGATMTLIAVVGGLSCLNGKIRALSSFFVKSQKKKKKKKLSHIAIYSSALCSACRLGHICN